MNTSLWKGIFVGAIVLGILYYPSLQGDFLFDDEHTVEQNQTIEAIWPLSRALWGPQDSPTAGRPLANLSFALNYAIGGRSVVGYHLGNLMLHLLNAIWVFVLIRATLRVCSERYRELSLSTQLSEQSIFGLAAMIAILWVVHPLHTETVSYVTQRTELLVAFFLFSTLYASIRGWSANQERTRLGWLTLSVFCCGLGMASKEVMVAAPVLIVFYDRIFLASSWWEVWMKRRYYYGGLSATWLILAGLLSTNPRGRSVGFGLSIGPFEYFSTQCWAIVRYLELAFWPSRLCGDYGTDTVTEPSRWLGCMLLLMVLGMATLGGLMRYRAASFAGLWFFAILGPTSSFVPIVSEPIAERRMYLPLLSVIALVIGGGWSVYQRYAKKHWSWNKPAIALAISIGIVLSGVTFSRNFVYRTDLAFWQDVVAKRPANARGHQNLGKAYFQLEKSELAREHFERAYSLAPQTSDSPYNLGTWHFNYGEPQEALRFFEEAIRLMPDKFEAHFNRGVLLERLGQIDQAQSAYLRAIEINPGAADPRLNLGNTYFAKGEWVEAIDCYKQVLMLDERSSQAYQNLGGAYAQRGQFEEAIGWLEKGIALDPNRPDSYFNLAYCHAATGDWDQAILHYQRCLEIRPNDAETWFAIGQAYARVGNLDKARESFEQTIRLAPGYSEAIQALEELKP